MSVIVSDRPEWRGALIADLAVTCAEAINGRPAVFRVVRFSEAGLGPISTNDWEPFGDGDVQSSCVVLPFR